MRRTETSSLLDGGDRKSSIFQHSHSAESPRLLLHKHVRYSHLLCKPDSLDRSSATIDDEWPRHVSVSKRERMKAEVRCQGGHTRVKHGKECVSPLPRAIRATVASPQNSEALV